MHSMQSGAPGSATPIRCAERTRILCSMIRPPPCPLQRLLPIQQQRGIWDHVVYVERGFILPTNIAIFAQCDEGIIPIAAPAAQSG